MSCPVRIRRWEFGAACVGYLLALLYGLTDSVLLGVGLAAGVSAAVAVRLRPLELPGVAGGHARRNAQLEGLKLGSLIVALFAVMGLLAEAALGHWSRDHKGLIAVFALAALEAMLLLEADRRADGLFNWLLGVRSEDSVRRELERLPADWFVTHNVLRGRGGNIDHIAVGSTGAFAIETKSGRYRGADGAQAIGAAMALREAAELSWVTAVVCVPGGGSPQQKGYVWVVGRDDLSAWLLGCREHRGRPIDVAAARDALAAG